MDCQNQLAAATERLAELKANVAKRKRLALVREAEVQVAGAEALVEKVKEAASIFADDSKLMDLSAKEINEASKRTAAAEKEANDCLVEVRKSVTCRQIEAKGKDASVEVSAELIKFQTRLSTAQAEVGRQRKLFTSVEQRLAVKRLLDEAEKKLKATEETVANAVECVSGGSEQTSDEASQTAVQEAQQAMRTIRRFLESQARTQGFAKDSLSKLDLRVKAAQERLDSTVVSMRERSEMVVVRTILQEAQQKVNECEASLQKVVEEESPFLQGDDGDLGLKKAQSMIAVVEKSIQAGQSIASSAKTFIAMKRLVAKRLSEPAARSTTEMLAKMQNSVEDATKKLTDMRKRCLRYKERALSRECWVDGGKGIKAC